jgi:hypothetical protein
MARARTWRPLMYRVVATLAGVLAAAGLPAGPALATGTLTSSVPLLWGISCSSTALCAAIDDKGHAVISTDPMAAMPTWTGSETGLVLPVSISCVATELCVAGDFNTGNVAISTDPTAATPTWTATVDQTHDASDGISCPTTSLCVVAAHNGEVAASTDPTAAAPTWTGESIDKRPTPFTEHLTAVSCPTSSLCVAVDSRGDASVSTDPGAVPPSWSAPAAIDSIGLAAISCPSTSLCVAVDYQGRAVTSTDPTASLPTWSAPTSTGSREPSAISCLSMAFCIASGERAGRSIGGVASADVAAAAPAWFETADLGGFGSIESPSSVSCASASLCVLTSSGVASISTDPTAAEPTWSAPAEIDPVPAGILSVPGSPIASGLKLTFIANCDGNLVEAFQIRGDGAIQECSGLANVTTAERLAHGRRVVIGLSATAQTKRFRTVLIGHTTIAPLYDGSIHTEQVMVALNATGKRLLAKFKSVPALLSVTGAASELRVPPKTVVTKTVRVTFRFKGTKRRKKTPRRRKKTRAS